MSRLPAALCVLVMACLALPAAAFPPGRSASGLRALAASIDAQLAAPRFARARWGIAVVSLDTGRTLYAHDADKLFEPASTAKLFTAAVVLDRLEADYRIPTRLFGGPLRHGRLHGPLLLYGMGDPSLGSAGETRGWDERLAAQVAAAGVRRVEGDLVVDDSYFSGPPFAPGWEANDRLAAFAAPSGALAVEENALRVTVAPGSAPGDTAQVSVTPASAVPVLDDRLQTVAPSATDDINLYRVPGSETLHAFGRVRAGTPPRHYHLAVGDPALAAGRALRAALARRGIAVDGVVRALHWPEDDRALRDGLPLLGELHSPPVAELLKDGLKRSQNLYLQDLLQLVGKREQADAAHDPTAPDGFLTTQAWGVRALQRLLDRIGVAPEARLLEEGTGLSRRDLVSPMALVRVLAYLAARPDADRLRGMLPLAGTDGTLAWRLRGTPAAGQLRAKTGSMAYVDSLAGFVTTAAGERLAFALMLEHYDPPADAPPAHAELDAIAARLAALRERSAQPAAEAAIGR